jgi:hypothetical protein
MKKFQDYWWSDQVSLPPNITSMFINSDKIFEAPPHIQVGKTLVIYRVNIWQILAS